MPDDLALVLHPRTCCPAALRGQSAAVLLQCSGFRVPGAERSCAHATNAGETYATICRQAGVSWFEISIVSPLLIRFWTAEALKVYIHMQRWAVCFWQSARLKGSGRTGSETGVSHLPAKAVASLVLAARRKSRDAGQRLWQHCWHRGEESDGWRSRCCTKLWLHSGSGCLWQPARNASPPRCQPGERGTEGAQRGPAGRRINITQLPLCVLTASCYVIARVEAAGQVRLLTQQVCCTNQFFFVFFMHPYFFVVVVVTIFS